MASIYFNDVQQQQIHSFERRKEKLTWNHKHIYFSGKNKIGEMFSLFVMSEHEFDSVEHFILVDFSSSLLINFATLRVHGNYGWLRHPHWSHLSDWNASSPTATTNTTTFDNDCLLAINKCESIHFVSAQKKREHKRLTISNRLCSSTKQKNTSNNSSKSYWTRYALREKWIFLIKIHFLSKNKKKRQSNIEPWRVVCSKTQQYACFPFIVDAVHENEK